MDANRIDAAVSLLKSFVDDRPDLTLHFGRTWTGAELDELEQRPTYVALPPSYRYWMERYGPMSVLRYNSEHHPYMPMVSPDDLYGVAPDVDDACGADDPDLEPSIGASLSNALFFQYQNNDSVQDFFVFSKDARREDGELFVLEYRHDEIFDNEPSADGAPVAHDYGFGDHLVWAVDKIKRTLGSS